MRTESQNKLTIVEWTGRKEGEDGEREEKCG